MAYIASKPEAYEGQVVGTGHCVPFVQEASGAPLTALWTKGAKVKDDATIAKGTAIATLDADGKYANKTDGTSHAAIYISKSAAGIDVWDQWKGQPVHRRTIRYKNGADGAKPVNDGDAYYVID